ncbi:aminotransferase class V-fold PLP-dependent enzyme [Intrasporangium calvum]|uniref:Aminotransferase class V-fold PLP-dependent enzyme n=1 Tax=Intrasporangium calvum TaxID=53358 RepID=A0ABT5GHB8_9MICO|nr:aminotransferase class V-fold PLP-dependent enzyme [Intrasporangium calvum]MDC5697647.1 aminotransferase class V-fold PLP-dependent enzyme [Intrasporangium calvum]
MDLPRADVDPDGLLEYSVVFTDRSLNHMSRRFIDVMQELLGLLRATYRANAVAVVPGGGTYAMEAVARQLATGRRALVVRNGFFSYRWSQIFEAGSIPSDVTVCKARPSSDAVDAAWSPAPIEEVVDTIRRERPEVVFAAHVETASGILLPDSYVSALAAATHEVGGLLVLDCIASGAMWVDMEALDVDVLISAPQKGWSGTPCAGYVMLGERGRAAVEGSVSTSFAANLRTWLGVADAYVEGRATYHATMPTDGLAHNTVIMRETHDRGLEDVRAAQVELGTRVRALLAERGFASVAAPGFESPGVVVVHTDDPALQSTARFREVGIQAAAGVPLQCDEPAGYSTFRLGLFGLDKLADIDGTVARLADGLDRLGIR